MVSQRLPLPRPLPAAWGEAGPANGGAWYPGQYVMSVRQTTRLRRAAPLPPAPTQRRVGPPRLVVVGLLASIAIIGILFIRGCTTGGSAPSAPVAPASVARPVPVEPAPARWLSPASAAGRGTGTGSLRPGWAAEPDRAALQAEIARWAADRDGVYGVVAVDLATGTRLAVNAATAFPPASLHKLLILAEAYRQVEAGQIALTDRLTIEPGDTEIGDPEGGLAVGAVVTVDRALEAMAEVSSNAAAAAMTRRLGPAAVAASAGRLGLRDTRYDPDDDQSAVTTPADVATYFERLAEGQIVSRSASQQILDRLARSRLNDRLPAGLPPGTVVAHKTGDLENVVHDAGIVYGPRGPIVIALLSRSAGNGRAAEDLRWLTRLIYRGLTLNNGS